MAKMITLSAYDCVEVDGYLYFFSREYNFLFKLEITTGEISIVDSIPEEKLFDGLLCSKIIHYEDCLYLAPINAEKIWKYSLKDGTWKGYDLKKIDGFEGKQAFYQAALYKDNIYFFGSRYPAMVIFDLKSEEIKYIENPYLDKIKGIVDKNTDVFFIKDYVQIDNCVYLASCLDNSVLKFDLDTYDYRYLYVGDVDMKYSGIGYDGKYFYLTPRKMTHAVKWDGAKSYEYIELNYLNPGDALMNIKVLCKDDKLAFYGNFPNKKFSITKAQADNIDVQSECRFYEKTGAEAYVSLNIDGKLDINTCNAEYGYLLQLEEDSIIDYISTKFQKSGECSGNGKRTEENELLIENNLVSLKLFTKLI